MKFTLVPILALCIGCVTDTRAADAAPAAVDPAKLAAFMEKWKDFGPRDTFPDDEADQPLLLAAMAKNPMGPWWTYLARDVVNAADRLPQGPPEERQRAVAKVVELTKQAEKIYAEAAVQYVSSRESLLMYRDMWQIIESQYVLEAGSRHLADARTLGQAMLAEPQRTNALNRGDMIYAGNQLLGRVALREDRVQEARDYLLKAGQAPVSSQLTGIGPNNLLAGELLRHGDPEDRKAVLAYLDAIAHFWEIPLPEGSNAKRRADDHLKRLAEWKEIIRADKIPDGPPWR